MSVLDKLATSLKRNDEMPNQELAKQIVLENDQKAIKELIINLNNPDKNIQSDCIKVLYEIGEENPSLIAEYADEFIEVLNRNNNRLIGGAMTALDALTFENPTTVYLGLAKIIEAANKGSVITKTIQ
jgi:HEAT repeat protein